MPRLFSVHPRIRHATYCAPPQRWAVTSTTALVTTHHSLPAIQPAPSSSPSTLRHFGDLTKLAHSRSANFLSKKNDIPYVEYSSNAELIRSSEVDPFAPAPGASKEAVRCYHAQLSKRLQQQQQQQQQQQGAATDVAAVGDPYAVQAEQIRQLSARVDEMQEKMRRARFLGSLGVGFATIAMLYFGEEDIKRFFYETETAQASTREKDELAIAGQPITPHREDEFLPLVILEEPEKATARSHKPFYRSLFWTSGSAGR